MVNKISGTETTCQHCSAGKFQAGETRRKDYFFFLFGYFFRVLFFSLFDNFIDFFLNFLFPLSLFFKQRDKKYVKIVKRDIIRMKLAYLIVSDVAQVNLIMLKVLLHAKVVPKESIVKRKLLTIRISLQMLRNVLIVRLDGSQEKVAPSANPVRLASTLARLVQLASVAVLVSIVKVKITGIKRLIVVPQQIQRSVLIVQQAGRPKLAAPSANLARLASTLT